MRDFSYHMPVKNYFGQNNLEDASFFNLPYFKAMIVTDNDIGRKDDEPLEILTSHLEHHKIKYIVFDSITHPLKKDHILKGAETARDFNCDFILGFGGGKALDAAKLIARFAKEDTGLLNNWIKSRTVPYFQNRPLDTVLVPTTINLASAINNKAFLHHAPVEGYVRFRDDSLYPMMSVIDPTLFLTQDKNKIHHVLLSTLIRAFDMIVQDLSIMHRMRAFNALHLIVRNLSDIGDGPLNKVTIHKLAFAVYTLNDLHMPKTAFPLHQINDAIEGYHETLPHDSFTAFAMLPYLEHRLSGLSEDDAVAMRKSFVDTPYHSKNLNVAFKNFFNALSIDPVPFKKFGLDLALVSDYVVQVKTLYPSFSGLSNDAIYDIIEKTLLA